MRDIVTRYLALQRSGNLVHQAEKRPQFGLAGARSVPQVRARPDLTRHEALICRSYVQK